MQRRRAHALLTWVPELALDALHRGGVIEPFDVAEFKGLARAARQKPLSLAALASDADVLEPGETVAGRVELLTRTPVFVDCYAGYGARIVKVPLSGLVAPQWHADMDYIDELKAALPPRDDEAALFDYSFGEDKLGAVALLNAGAQQVGVVNVPRGQPPRVGRMSAEVAADRHRVTFSVDVEARPHLVHVMAAQVAMQQGPVQLLSSRLIVLDGVHRLLAMLSSGYTHAYAVMLTELAPQQLATYMGGGGPHLVLDAALGAQRPPRLDDYLDEAVFDVVSLQSLEVSLSLVVSPQFQQRPVDFETESNVPVTGVKTETLGKARARRQPARR
jgi:hypothetical protein